MRAPVDNGRLGSSGISLLMGNKHASHMEGSAAPEETQGAQWGIDTVRVGVPVDLDNCDLASLLFTHSGSTSTGSDKHVGSRSVGDAKVYVNVSSLWSQAFIEFRAPGLLTW